MAIPRGFAYDRLLAAFAAVSLPFFTLLASVVLPLSTLLLASRLGLSI
jgi:hypothetical protein